MPTPTVTGMTQPRPIYRTFMLDPAIDVDVAIEAYMADGWQFDGRGCIATIEGISYRILPVKRFDGLQRLHTWRADTYETPPGMG